MGRYTTDLAFELADDDEVRIYRDGRHIGDIFKHEDILNRGQFHYLIRIIVDGITVEGTQIADERESLLWGFVNCLHSQGQDSHDVGASKGGDGMVPETGARKGHEVIARDNGSEDAASSAPQGERAATCDENRRPLGRPPCVVGPLGARKKRRKASQDFY